MMKLLKTLFITALLIAMVRPVHATDESMFDDVSFIYDAHLSKEVERLNGEIMSYDMDSLGGSFTGLLMDFDMFMSFGIETYRDDVTVNFESDELELQHVEVSMLYDNQLLFKKKVLSTEDFKMDDSLRLDEAEYEFRFKYFFKEVKHHYFMDIFMDNHLSQADVRLFDETLSVDERVLTVSQKVLLDHLLAFDKELNIESIYLHNVIDESGIHHKRVYRLSDLPENIQFIECVSDRLDERWSKPSIHVQFINNEDELIKPHDEKGLYSFDFLDDWPYPKEGISDVLEYSPLKAGLDVSEIRFIAPAINVDQNTRPIGTINHLVTVGLDEFWIEVQQFSPIKLNASEAKEERLIKTLVGRNPWYDYLEAEDLERFGVSNFKDKLAYDDIYSYQLVYDETLDKTYIYSNAMEEGYRLGLYDTLDGNYVSNRKNIPKGIIPHYGVDMLDDVIDGFKPPIKDDEKPPIDRSNTDGTLLDQTNSAFDEDVIPYVDVKTSVSHPKTYTLSFIALLSSLFAWLLKKY